MTRTPFIIQIDTREQAPWMFADMQMPVKGKWQTVEVQTEEICLGENSGDYAIKGFDSVRIERKSIWDLYGTLANRDAFREQIAFMDFAFRASFVIIEASWQEVCNPANYRKPLFWWNPEQSVMTACEREFREVLYVLCENEHGRWNAIRESDQWLINTGTLTECIAACELDAGKDEGWRSQLNPRAVENTIASWSSEFPRVHWHAPGGRREAEVFAFNVLRHHWRKSTTKGGKRK